MGSADSQLEAPFSLAQSTALVQRGSLAFLLFSMVISGILLFSLLFQSH